jgi:hypothetical protein
LGAVLGVPALNENSPLGALEIEVGCAAFPKALWDAVLPLNLNPPGALVLPKVFCELVEAAPNAGVGVVEDVPNRFLAGFVAGITLAPNAFGVIAGPVPNVF